MASIRKGSLCVNSDGVFGGILFGVLEFGIESNEKRHRHSFHTCTYYAWPARLSFHRRAFGNRRSPTLTGHKLIPLPALLHLRTIEIASSSIRARNRLDYPGSWITRM